MRHPSGDWWEYRSTCQLCGWEGPDSEITGHKQMGWAKVFDICPSCHNWKYKRQLLMRNRTGRPIYSHTSCLSGRAVHKGCGKWHQPGTDCPVSAA